MSAVTAIARDGRVHIIDRSLSPDEVLEAALRYNEAADEAQGDLAANRYVREDRWSGPALGAAIDDLAVVCAPGPLTPAQAREFAAALTRAADAAEVAA